VKKSRFSDSQIIAILKQAEGGTLVPELCRENGISSATFYKWRSKFGGMDASLMARLKELEDENRRLKKMYAEERLKAEIVKEALEKKWFRHLTIVRWRNGLCVTKALRCAWPALCLASARPVTATRRSCWLRMTRLQIT
jgi:putative transposase